MILLLLSACFALAALAWAGLVFSIVIKRLANIQNWRPGLPELLMIGIVGLTGIASLLSLLLPISGPVVCGIWVVCSLIGAAFYKTIRPEVHLLIRKLIDGDRTAWLCGIAYLLAVVFIAAGEQGNSDTGLYHAQSVKWIVHYGVVPGLGNLHPRFGYNSSWFVFSALWDQFLFRGLSYHLVNLLIYMVGGLLSLRGAIAVSKGQRNIFSFLECGTVFPLILLRLYVSSLSPDIPEAIAVFFAIIIAVRLMEQPNMPPGERNGQFITLCLLSAFAMTVKLSGVPCLLFCLACATRMQPRTIWLGGISIALILAGFLSRNVMISGYLVYPLPEVDLFNVDWKISPERARFEKEIIHLWGIRPQIEYREFAAKGILHWFPWWFVHKLHTEKLNFLAFCLDLLQFPLLAFFTWKSRSFPLRRMLIPSFICLCGVTFWLVNAPDFRFGFGWVMGAALLAISIVLSSSGYNLGWSLRKFIPSALTIVLILMMVRGADKHSFRQDPSLLLFKLLPLPIEPMLTQIIPPGQVIYYPANTDRAWDAPLPSANHEVPGLMLRGNTLREGFRKE